MGEQVVVYPYNGISHNYKRIENYDECNKNESQTHYIEKKKPDTKEYVLCFCLYKFLEKVKVIHSDRKHISLSLYQVWSGERLQRGKRELFKVLGNLSIFLKEFFYCYIYF